MEKETKHTPEHFKVIKSFDGYCLGYVDDGSMEHFVAERIYNKAYADLFASAPTLKAENEKLKEAHNLEMRAAHTLRAKLSEMKKEREELVEMLEISLSLLQRDVPLSDKLEYDIQQIIQKHKK